MVEQVVEFIGSGGGDDGEGNDGREPHETLGRRNCTSKPPSISSLSSRPVGSSSCTIPLIT